MSEYEYERCKIMESIKQGILLCMMTFAFWGVLYPQFSLVEESYDIIQNEKGMQIKKNSREDFFAILDADKGELVISSKLLELLRERVKK